MPAEQRYVLAATDGPPAQQAVLHVAGVMADILELPLRRVHVVPGTGLRGEARRSALSRVERGESQEMRGRPEDVLTTLADAAGTALAVLGIRQRPRRPGARRVVGTAMAVARRSTRPVLLTPASAVDWVGPRRVLTPLDGTGATAMAAAKAVAEIRRPDTVGIPWHVVEEGSSRRFWDGPPDEYDTWRAGLPYGTPADLQPASGPVGQQVLERISVTGSDLVVLVWSRQTRGGHAAAVLDVLAATRVPVLLVPVAPGA